MSLRAALSAARHVGVMLSLIAIGCCCSLSLTAAEPAVEEVEDAILVLVNQERLAAGLTPLARDDDLDELASVYSATGFSKQAEESGDLRYLLCNSWRLTYRSGPARLHDATAREQVDYCLGEPELRGALMREEATATGVGVAVVGDTVYFTQVFDVLNAVGGDGGPIRLVDHPYAQDPSWAELQQFLLEDDTDGQPYVLDSFVCSDFAAMLHNRAEAAGMKAAYVSVDFDSGPGHALNAFRTTDKGLVFIDCTGQGLHTIANENSLSDQRTPEGYDRVAYVSVGREYGLIGLDRATSFGYDFYEWRCHQWADYEEKAHSYNDKCDAYEELLAGRTVISDPEEYAALKSMSDELDTLRAELETQRETLGGYRWKSPGIVSSLYVHW